MVEQDVSDFERFFTEAEAAGPHAWAGPGQGPNLRSRFAEDEFLGREPFHLAIEANGRFVGFVSWHSVPTGQGSWCWSIGIGVLPKHRGHGYATNAQRQLVDRLFATTEANRVEATTDVENEAEQRSLIKSGFTREGVLRGHQRRSGVWHDMVMFSRLRTDAVPDAV
jgi:RimJ/RimL family protein N-acetyltransferase